MSTTARALFGSAATAAAGAVVLAVGVAAGASTWIDVVAGVLFLGVGLLGLLMVERDRGNPAAWVLLAASAGAATLPVVDLLAPHVNAAAGVFLTVVGALAGVALFGLFTLGVLLFPDGRAHGRFGRALVVGAWGGLGLLGVGAVLDGVASGAVANSSMVMGFLLIVPVTILAALGTGLRRRGAAGVQRRALALLEVTAWVNAGAFLTCGIVSALATLPEWFGTVAEQTGVVFAVAAWVAIIRFRLVDLRAAISRTLPYLAMSALAVAVAAAAASLFGSLANGRLAAGLAAAIAALVALPLRSALQRVANLLVYGRTTDPAQTLARLAERLRDGTSLAEPVEGALTTIGTALGVKAIVINDDDDGSTSTQRVSLSFAGQSVGALELAGRLRPADLRLLQTLAPHLAAAVHAGRLEVALRDSHRRLVAARDEERRRIRRDLHDGLGPTLAGMMLGVEATERHLADPARARADLARLHETSQDAVREIRRIVYALRPPALDSLGLDGAIREQANRLGAIAVEVDELPDLPDTLEIGVYHIALEAMKNAATHAQPGTFWVRLAADVQLALEVHDDGPGLPETYVAGLGINSMRDRAAELGGTVALLPRQPTGTLVRAEWVLPS